MAQTESRIRLVFDGVERGVAAAARKAERAVKSLDDSHSRLSKSSDAAGKSLLSVGKGLALVGSAGGAVKVVGATAGALAQLAPAALLLPGALLAGAAAMGTFKIATAGMGDALKAGLSGDMEKFAEATKDMAPEMQAAARAVVAFKPKIDDLRKRVQGNFWGQFSGDLKGLGDNLLPVATDGLGDIATQMGAVAKGAVKAGSTPFFRGAVGSILSDTAGFFREVGDAAGDVITGIVGIGKVGATYLPRLGEGVGGVAKRFREWVEQNSEAGGAIERLIDGALKGFRDLGGIVKNVGSIGGSVFKGLGTDMSSPLARIRELTGQVAEFMKTAAAQDGLRALGETLRVVGDVVGRVVMTALRELAPTLVKLAPVAQEVARTLGDLLVNALETLGPIVRGVASVLGEFPGVIGPATAAVVGLVAAVRTMRVISEISGWVSGAKGALSGFGKAVDDVDRKASTAAGPKGGLGRFKGALRIGAVVGIGAAVAAFGDVEKAADGAATGIDHARGAVGQFTQAASTVDLGFFLDEFISEVKFGAVVWQQFKNNMSGWQPDPIKFDVNTGPAQDQITGFMNSLKGKVGTVNINGRTEDAAQALADIVQAINQGRGTVTLDGREVPAQEALARVVRQIDTAGGMVDINGNKEPAGQVLARFVRDANTSRPSVTVDANTNPALARLRSLYATWNGRMINLQTGGSRVGGFTGGAVTGGTIVPHFGVGGPVRGPGGGTSDNVPAMLSNGEWVMNAAEVKAAGGFKGMAAITDALRGRGPSPMASSAAAAVRPAPPAAAPSGGGVQVTFTGNTSDALATVIMGMIRQGKIQIKAA